MTHAARDVDVILPTYRGKRWVDEAIGSVLAQSHTALRLIVVDDASGDGTLEHLRERWGAEPRVETLTLAATGRAAGARMHAVARARGELLAFIDQDDRWRPDKLARQIERLDAEPAAAAVHTDCVHIDEMGAERSGSARAENAARAGVPWNALDRDGQRRACFLANRIRLASALLRRDAFTQAGGFDTTLFGGEDWDFWLRFATAGRRIAHLPEPLLERRIHGEATSTARRRQRLDGLYDALDRAIARDPALAPLAAARLETLLRRELASGDGAALRARLRERGAKLALAPRAGLWLASWLAPLAAAHSQP